jgi:hypothetical protein
LVATNTLYCDDVFTLQQRAAGIGLVEKCQCIKRESSTVASGKREARSACVACDWLGMEAAILWILILRGARRAHRKNGHRRLGSIVWNPFDDAEPRTTMRAIRERIAKAPGERVESLLRASCTDSCVRGDLCPRGPGSAGNNAEIGWRVKRWYAGALDLLDTSERWCFKSDAFDQSLEGSRLTPRLDKHAVSIIADKSAHSQRVGDAPNCGAESDALHDPPYTDSFRVAYR